MANEPALLYRASQVIGIALCGSGLYGLINPIHMSHIFGILNAGRVETTFYRGLAGRNLGMGIGVLALARMRDRRALGTLILCLLCNGFSDTYICMTEAPPVVHTWVHLMNMGIATTVGSGLLGWWKI